MDNVKVSTHAPRQPLSRLGLFRLKDAARRRDLAIAAAHDRYNEEVRAITGTDRAVTLAQRANKRANAWCWRRGEYRCKTPAPALANPLGHALQHVPEKPWWLLDVRELLGGSHG